jgi:hypothetical protein
VDLFHQAAFLFLSSALLGDVESGPKVGEKVSTLDVFAVVGEVEDKRLDVVKSRKERRTLYLFINDERWARPVARFIKKLDDAVSDSKDRATVVAVWISRDVDKTKNYLPVAQQSLKFERTSLFVAAEPVVSPPGWEINADAALTAVLVKDGKVSSVFAFDSVNDGDVRKVAAAWKKLDAKPAESEKKKPAADSPPVPKSFCTDCD